LVLLSACGPDSERTTVRIALADAKIVHAAAHVEPARADGHGAPPAQTAHAKPAHWAYGDESHWGDTCASGKAQSPIPLRSSRKVLDLAGLSATYPASEGALLDNGHTLQFTPESDGELQIGADAYKLAQFHFHAPSEHSLNGTLYPAELHFVNKTESASLAVVGVFIKEGPANPALAALLAALPEGEGEDHASRPRVDMRKLLPKSRTYIAYSGSLTTPPCSEGVRWNVLATPITASAAQIEALSEALGPSNRALQAVNGRAVGFGS
jgi:carbonic anhydrase